MSKIKVLLHVNM